MKATCIRSSYLPAGPGLTLWQAGVELFALDLGGQRAFGRQLPLHDLTGEEYRSFGRIAVEDSCEEACPESIPGTRDVHDLDGPGGDVGGDPAVLGDQVALFAHGEHDGLGAEVVEHIDELLGFVVGAEDPPGVVEGRLGHVDVAVGIADYFPGFLVVGPDPPAVVGVERDDLAHLTGFTEGL